MTAAFALGDAIDGKLHLAEAWAPQDSARIVSRSCLSLVMAAAATAAGFPALLGSGFGLTRAFGLVSAVVLCAALVGDLVVRPALLDRWAPAPDVGPAPPGEGARE